MERIVLFRSGALGDCIVSIPTLRLLRQGYPKAHITMIGNTYSGHIFDGADYLDDIHLLDYKSEPLRYLSKLLSLRRNRYDLSVDFQATGRTRGQTAFIGAKRRIAFDVKGIPDPLLYTDKVADDRTIHAAERFAKLLLPLGIERSPEPLYPTLDISEEHRAKASFLLRQNEVLKPFVVLQCSCGKRPADRHWPAERFAAVADWFWEQGIQVVVTSAREDRAIAQVLAAAKYSITNLTGTTEPLVLAAILEQALLYAGYNTGTMHLAGAVRTPIVALYDLPADLIEWAPRSTVSVRIVKSELGIDKISSQNLISEISQFVSELQTPSRNRFSVR